MRVDLGIANKRVLITGASRGLGLAVARAFAAEGARLSLVARDEQRLAELVAELGGDGLEHDFVSADLMVPGAPTRVGKQVLRSGPVEIVVHNVGGTLQVRNPLSPAEDWLRVWQYNVGIAIELNRVIVPPMQERRWGRVIHISSTAGDELRGSAPYAVSKAYLNAYTKTLGRALAPDGVVVSAVLPGAFIAPGNHWDFRSRENPEMVKDFLRHHAAIGRLGTPEDIAPFALFMASEQAVFANASLVPVSGGSM